MEYHYTAREAIERLGLPRSTFYNLVRSGQINKIDLPLRKQSLYLKDEIDRLAAKRKQVLNLRQTNSRMLSLSIPSRSDLDQWYKIMWPWPKSGPSDWDAYVAELQHYNPEIMHVLKDTSTDTVLGGLMMSPLKPDALQRVMDRPYDSWIIDPSDCLPFDAPNDAPIPVYVPINVYVFHLFVPPSLRTAAVAALLLRGIFRFLESLLDRGVIVHYIFANGFSPDADRLACKLGFDRLPVADAEDGSVPDFGDASVQRYALNLLNVGSESKLARAYQRSHRNLIRRMHRYEQTVGEAKVS